MVLIYIAKSNLDKIKGELDFPSYAFKSPTETQIDHTASKVILVGNYPAIKKLYAGICKIETMTVKELPVYQECLLGSDRQPSEFVLSDDSVLTLGDIVVRAQEKSGLSVKEWNKLAQEDSEKQEALIQAEVDLLNLKEETKKEE